MEVEIILTHISITYYPEYVDPKGMNNITRHNLQI